MAGIVGSDSLPIDRKVLWRRRGGGWSVSFFSSIHLLVVKVGEIMVAKIGF
jgi:hypothetical protein